MAIKGIIFDMDGVVTQTAVTHYNAWKVILDQLLFQIDSSYLPFTEEEYFNYLDGMPRIDGISNFINSRQITFKDIQNLYSSMDECIEDICHKKNLCLLSNLASQKVKCFPDTLEFIEYLLINNYAIAIISSSKNCFEVLKSATIENLFPVRVDGKIAQELGIPGKPNPAIFLEAANRLNLLPEECMVIEDALAGVKAAKEGKFGLVIALDRQNKLRSKFNELGADYILPDLSKKQILFYQKILNNKINILESAFNALPLISNLIKNDNELIIFLDYDGTLTPIVDHPEYALLPPLMFQCLSELSRKYRTVIISGRKLDNLKRLINVPNIFYSGNHGLEFEGPEHSKMFYQMGHEFVDDLQSIFTILSQELASIEGCVIENKKFSLSIHYRMVEEASHEFISNKIDEYLTNFPNLSRHYGKKVFEIRPNIQWNKGIAAENILNQLKTMKNNLIPIYIGDDVTDEDAFKQLSFKGINIKVTSEFHKTHASYFLKSPKKVLQFLNYLNNFKEVCYESLDYQSSEF
ncbi:beta-phosphoglucomutase [Legionella wadsworthii]|uniref:Trehalose 6-phosphate phosphatase n=1 Tax=Legionella wadsworthii TaxID=28088 RepID=A0A378LSG9_9GAMM|nr:trehalose-phosphatase [Legionella wadsworthii]STY29637.1 beta-phosphoglucomutase [Legionella wadsworthii]